MMPSQFVHLSCYGLVASANRRDNRALPGIVGEQLRVPSRSRHVLRPLAPIRIVGEDPRRVLAEVRRRHRVECAASGSVLRRDALVALVGVSSWPSPTWALGDVAEHERFNDWQRREVAWLRDVFGDALRSVVLHRDEPFPHHHWIVVDRQRLADTLTLHPGMQAKRAAREAGGSGREQAAAYRAAMVLLQDDYHRIVGAPCGLTRTSDAPRPRVSRRRVVAALRRGEWVPGVGPVDRQTVADDETAMVWRP